MAERRPFFDLLIQPFRRKVPPTRTAGVMGTSIIGGFIQENELNQELTGREKYKTFSDILANTSIVAAGTRYFLNLISKARWRMEPVDDTPRARELADELTRILHAMETPWHRVVRRAAMYRFYGFALQEWTARRDKNGVMGMKDIAPRGQVTIERWDVQDTGEVLGVIQRAPRTQEEIYLPRGKLIYTVDDTLNDSPMGLGLFRHLVQPNRTLERFQQLEGFAFETDLRGTPVGRAPMAELQRMVEAGTLSPADKTKLEAPMRDFVQNHIKTPTLGLLLDSITYQSQDDASTPSNVKQWDFDIIQGEVSGQADVAAAIERLNREMARVLGVEQLLLGSGDRGSHALARDKTQTFALMVDSTLQELEEVMERDFRDVVWSLNGWPEELKPEMRTQAVQYRDVEQITSALDDMARAGAILTPNDPAINEVRDLLGLSQQEEIDLADLALLAPEPKPPPEEE